MKKSSSAAEAIEPDTIHSAGGGISRRDAETVDSELTAISGSKGRLSTAEMAEELVRRARSPSSPVHHMFEWNDKRAAEGQRLNRARQLIRCVYVVLAQAPEVKPTRKWVTVTEGGKKGPTPIQRVLTSRDMTAEVLEKAKAEALAWAERYKTLEKLAEVSGVFRAIAKLKRVTKK